MQAVEVPPDVMVVVGGVTIPVLVNAKGAVMDPVQMRVPVVAVLVVLLLVVPCVDMVLQINHFLYT